MDPKQVRMMKMVLLASSVATLLVLSNSAVEENIKGQWRQTQKTYKAELIRTADTDAAKRSAESFAIEYKQIYLPALGTIDRCTTCHLGIENPKMAQVAQPLCKHSGRILEHHPTDKFGCTVCHQGRGRATDKYLAHGWRDDETPVPHIDEPMLRGDAVYTSCGKCHDELELFGGPDDLFAGAAETDAAAHLLRAPIRQAMLARSLAGADRLTNGKQLVVRLGCLGCHKYRGRGGTLGTDLTYVGDKTRHDFDFTNVKGEHTVEQWLFEHFKYPREVSPDTVMPDMGLTDDQARDLTLYMMSLHKKSAPASHLPAQARIAQTGPPVRGETLYAMFCSACHGPDGYGTTMRQGLWPVDADPWGHNWDARNVVSEKRSDIDVMVPSLHHADTLATASDDYLRRIIARGRPGTKMPGWRTDGGLSDDEITLLISFIRSWDQPVPDRASVASRRGDPRVGGALYRANCAACHGQNGQGGIGNTLNSATFLAAASDAFLRDTIVFGRPNTAMPAWRSFDAQELSDLLAFIRQWQPKKSGVETAVRLCEANQSDDVVSADIGRTLYKANCVMCHGLDGSGDLGPSLNTQSFLTVVPDSFIVDTLISGRPGTGMPSWRHLSNEDIASLVAYLRTWQTEPSKDQAWHERTVPRGDWDAGQRLFAGHCAGCHGPDAEGATGPQLSNPVFLRNATDPMLEAWLRYGKTGTQMRGFRKGGQGITELTDRQIEDIIAYLRFLQRAGDEELVRTAKYPNGRPEKGALVYARNCVACHGEQGQGASGPALANANFLQFASDGFLMATMALGRSGTEMRPVKRGPQSILSLSSDEVNDLVALLRSWESEPPAVAGRTIPHRFVIPWDLARGKQLFTSNCSGCHGEEGRGSWAPELHNEGFLAAATDGFLQATIVRGRKGTAMRPFGHGAQGLTDLRPQDIDDIVAYMRQWSTQTPSPMTLPAERSLQPPANPSTTQPAQAHAEPKAKANARTQAALDVNPRPKTRYAGSTGTAAYETKTETRPSRAQAPSPNKRGD